MKITAFVSHEDVPRHDTGWGHRDHQGRIPAIIRAVYRDLVALYEPVLQLAAEPASDDDFRLVHTERHIGAVSEAVVRSVLEERTLELDGVPVSGASMDAARGSVGGALTAVDAVLRGEVRNAFVVARPPGAGAVPDCASGSCLFNTIAIAARHLRERRGVARVLVVTWGAAPASGIRACLEDVDGVMIISLHQGTSSATEPGNVPLAPGTTGADFALALREALDAVPADESPDFLLLSAGFDILAADPHGDLAVEPADIHPITRALVEWADARAGGRLVSVLEGGYDADATARAVVQHLRALVGLPPA